jgi:hypothetical protein
MRLAQSRPTPQGTMVKKLRWYSLLQKQALIVHSKEECWYLNSGATAHIPCKKGWLHNYII